MSYISGYVEVEVLTPPDEEEQQSEPVVQTLSVPGSEFGLEEGGNWRRDPDDGEWSAGFLFIAFCEGFSLRLSFDAHGTSILDYSLSVVDASIKITRVDDELILDGIRPPL